MSRHRTRRDHRRTKSTRRKPQRHYKLVGQTVALTVALATSNAMPQEADRRATFTLPPVDVQDQRSPFNPTNLGLFRLPQPIRDIPQSITVIPQELMQEQAVTSFRDALRNVTGISLAAGEGGGAQGDNLTLRGFNARNDYFLDGIRDQGSYTRDVFNLEAIEVLKGPSAVLFGRGSTGGAINQISKTPRLEPLYTASVSVGTGQLLRGTADINQPLSKSVALRVNLLAHDSETVDRNEAHTQRFGLAPSITFGLGTPTQLTLSYLVQTENNIPDYGIPYLFGKPVDVDRANFYGLAEEDFEEVLFNVFTARLDHRFNEQFNLRSTLRYSRTDREAAVTSSITILGNPTPTTPLSSVQGNRGTRPGRDTEEGILTSQTELIARFHTLAFKHTLSSGLEVALERFDATRFTHANVPNVTNLANPEVRPDTSRQTEAISARTSTDATSFAIYAVDQIRLLPKLDLLGGLRFDLFAADFDSYLNNQHFERTDTKVNWRAGLVFRPTSTMSYYFSSGTSFNPSAEALALAANNADTPPEENISYEVGAKIGLFDDMLSLQGALFRIVKTNARTTDPDTQLLVLEGKQRVQGFEVGLTGRPLPRWNLFTGFTYLDSKTLESQDIQNGVPVQGKELQNTPRYSATLWTTYDIGEKWQVGTGVFYLSERFANTSNTIEVPKTVRWDATVAYQINRNIQLRFNAQNLTDELYYETNHPSHTIPGAGRTFILTGNFRY
jgi:catecholate siderophore receptor